MISTGTRLGRYDIRSKIAVDSLNRIIREPIRPITDLRPDAAADLQGILRRCLAKDPEERYQTIKDVAIELKEVRREFANTDYLSDGVTESIINSLTQIPNLRVIARGSSFRYKGRDTDPVAAGHELGVRAVLTAGRNWRAESGEFISPRILITKNRRMRHGVNK